MVNFIVRYLKVPPIRFRSTASHDPHWGFAGPNRDISDLVGPNPDLDQDLAREVLTKKQSLVRRGLYRSRLRRCCA
ncbi:hypothetical protein, partial [Mesorhizobium sp.]|uniref:hypothetical protein n=2 Tax=unclassified Mesorhizobium TaxID=325217 RepID=UPI0025BB4941